MPNAVLARSLEDELEGSLLGNARSQFPSAAPRPPPALFSPLSPLSECLLPSHRSLSPSILWRCIETLRSSLFFRLSAPQLGSALPPRPTQHSTAHAVLRPQAALWRFYYIECNRQSNKKNISRCLFLFSFLSVLNPALGVTRRRFLYS